MTGNLEYEEALAIGVGVLDADARGLADGGPIERSTVRVEDFDIVEGVAAAARLLARVLFPRADTLAADESVSVDNFLPLEVALTSDMAEEGREEGRTALGVANALGALGSR